MLFLSINTLVSFWHLVNIIVLIASKMINNKTQDVPTLKALISAANTNQRELSNRIGLSERTLNDWVAGKKIPRLDNALIIAKELKVSLKTLSLSLGLDVSGIPDDE